MMNERLHVIQPSSADSTARYHPHHPPHACKTLHHEASGDWNPSFVWVNQGVLITDHFQAAWKNDA
jgi:hypothetical protein